MLCSPHHFSNALYFLPLFQNLGRYHRHYREGYNTDLDDVHNNRSVSKQTGIFQRIGTDDESQQFRSRPIETKETIPAGVDIDANRASHQGKLIIDKATTSNSQVTQSHSAIEDEQAEVVQGKSLLSEESDGFEEDSFIYTDLKISESPTLDEGILDDLERLGRSSDRRNARRRLVLTPEASQDGDLLQDSQQGKIW